MVYETTTNSFWFFNGTAWTQIGSGGVSPWTVNGNNINNTNSGRVGIGPLVPKARMAVDSSLMIDQANTNDNTLGKGALLFGSDGKVGIFRNTLCCGFNSRSGLSFTTNDVRWMLIDSMGRVGINTPNPSQFLHVNGNAVVNGSLGIGSSTPDYAFENLGGYNYMYYSLGIGTGIVPSSTWKLDVNGNARFQQDVRINGFLNPSNTLNIGNIAGSLTVNSTASIAGSLTVNNNKGVAYDPSTSANLKIRPFTTGNFHAILGLHGSAETSISLPGGFTSTLWFLLGTSIILVVRLENSIG